MTTYDETPVDIPEMSKEEQLAAAKQAIAGPVPLIEEPPNPVVNLPRGLLKGDWHTEAFVRELTGEDEEYLARVKDLVEFYDIVLARGVEQIGSVDLRSLPTTDRQGLLQSLLVGERAMLLMAIVRNTYGDSKLLTVTCGTCQVEQEVELILSEDFKPKEMANPQQLTYTFTTSKGDSIEYRLVTGADQLAATGKKGASLPEQNSIVMSRCITRVNGQLIVDPLDYARKLSMKDRRGLLSAMVDNQPNIDLTINTKCIGCGEEQRIPLGWGDLFQS